MSDDLKAPTYAPDHDDPWIKYLMLRCCHIEDALDARDAETKRLREALEKYEGRQVRGGKSE